MRDEESNTLSGQLAIAAARLVTHMPDRPGMHDFFEEFKPLEVLFELEARAAENALAQTSAAAEEGKRLYLYQRGVELANAIQAAKAEIYEFEQRKRK